MITQDEVERALEYLIKTAEEAATARSIRLHLEQFVKTTKAQCMAKHLDGSMTQAEVKALIDEDYLTALNGLKEAIHDDEKLRYLTEAAKIKVDVWRSLESSKRALGV